MRPIDADALIKTIDSHCYPVQHDMTSIEPGMTRIGIIQAIQEQPTVEPERAKGEWLADTNEFDEWYCCSVCHKGLTMFDGTYDFCPNCGADMRGDSE